MQYTKTQIEERIQFYTNKIESIKTNKQNNLSVYQNLLNFWIAQLSKLESL